MMLTIRLSEDEHARILAAAKADGRSYQKWALPILLEHAPELPKREEEEPIAEGFVRLYPAIAAFFDILRPAEIPGETVRIRQYQEDGSFYCLDAQDEVIMLDNALLSQNEMLDLIPREAFPEEPTPPHMIAETVCEPAPAIA